jgi:hypothetical protein
VLYRKRDPNVGANGVPNFRKAPISDSIKIRGEFFGYHLKKKSKFDLWIYENGKHFPFS